MPAELWKESGHWQQVDETLWRTRDRNGRDFVLAMTHEEVVTDLSRHDVRSYRQLPYVLYQIQTKVRDEPRPRGGLVRMREFLMKDAYSFHCDTADLDAYYPRIYQANVNVYRRVGVPVVPVEADPGMIGGSGSHEFVYPSDLGEAVILRCPSCGYAANQEIARAQTADQLEPVPEEVPRPVPVHTPNVATISDVPAFLDLPADALLKTLIYHTGRELAAAVIHGDRDVNEVKLANALGVAIVHANHDERGIIWPGAVAPYPVHLVGLNLDFPEVAKAAESVYATLGAAGVETLFDDRPESPGVKFADADLIGVPLRLTVSRRSLRQNAVELTVRESNQSSLVPVSEVATAVGGYVV